MIKHHIKLARKTLQKNGYYTLINVLGLVCGTLTALIIAIYLGSAFQYDQFHVHKDRIYAIEMEESVDKHAPELSHTCYWGLGERVQQFPEVTQVTRMSFHVESLVKHAGETGKNLSYMEKGIRATDSNFLTVFTFPLIHGDPKTALSRTHSIVLSRAASQKYFGPSNPLGKTLLVRAPWGREDLYQVTGVLEELPQNTRFTFDFLIPHSPVSALNQWDFPNYTTYVLLNSDATASESGEKFTQYLSKEPILTAANKQVEVSLASITAIRLSSREYILAVAGVFILLISWVNFLNQLIAQSYARTKQIGILKVIGASSKQVKMQFAIEAALVCLLSLLLALGIYLSIEPSLQAYTHGRLLPLSQLSYSIPLLFASIFALGILLAATIPMILFSSRDHGSTLRKVQGDKMGRVSLRKALVVVQFTLSTIMLFGIFVISNQLEFMKRKDKGLNMEDVLIIKAPIIKNTTWREKRKTLELIKENYAQLPFVQAVTSSTTIASEAYRNETYLGFPGSTNKVMVHQNGIDEHYFGLYEVEFVAGHNFMAEGGFKNRESMILNESAARKLGITDFSTLSEVSIVDHESDESYTLIGIVKDYHKTSLKYGIEPIAFKFNPFRGHLSLKINGSAWEADEGGPSPDKLHEIWSQYYGDAAFNHFSLAQQFEAQDADDRNFGTLFYLGTMLSMLISCLGLLGLSLFISIKRQKEIGIRKVFGASTRHILVSSYLSYAKPLLLSILMGVPLAYLLMQGWLSHYAYRAEIGLGTFLGVLGMLTLIFMSTISFHIIRSSAANPVSMLKTE